MNQREWTRKTENRGRVINSFIDTISEGGNGKICQCVPEWKVVVSLLLSTTKKREKENGQSDLPHQKYDDYTLEALTKSFSATQYILL